MPDAPKEISLLDSLNAEWIKLGLAVMRDVGPAAQTLGAIMRISKGETFVSMQTIADCAQLPLATVRKHVPSLCARGWINHKGRERTRRGFLRRTCTIAVTKKSLIALEPTEENPLTYGFLPWWACWTVTPWCARAVLSVVMARLASVKKAVEDQDGRGLEAGDIQGSIENMGVEDHFRFSLKWLTKQTGLDHKSLTKAKNLLNHRFGIVCWQGSRNSPGVATTKDLLIPNWDFRAIVTPVSQTKVKISFSKRVTNGQ